MIKETYVSFEVAKILKEKGFNDPCLRVYDKNGIISIRYLGFDIPHNYTNSLLYLCPTHQMAMAWLREEKNIFISICNGNHCKFDKNISSETVYYFFSITNSYGVYKEEEQCFDEFKTYEEAVEAAVKYCLENLI